MMLATAGGREGGRKGEREGRSEHGGERMEGQDTQSTI
jgi:hypothetical protein